MLAWDLFKHYLLSRRSGSVVRWVSWLCVIGVTVAIFALVTVLSVMTGLHASSQRRLLAVEPHLVVSVPGVQSLDALQEHAATSYLRSLTGVKADLFETQDVILRTVEGYFGGAVARGVEPSSFQQVLRDIRSARVQSMGYKPEDLAQIPEATELGAGEIYLGLHLARSLGVLEGDKVVVIAPEGLLLPAGEAPPFERVLVRGLVATNVPEIDMKGLYYGRGQSLTHLQKSLSRQVGIEVRLPDPEDYEAIKSELQARGATVMTWRQRNSSLFYALRMEKIVIGSFLGLSGLIASFSIVTVLVLLLTQKKKDIGVLMAMGLSPRETLWAFVKVGMFLSSVGIFCGLVLALLACFVLNTYPLPILPDIYYDATLPAKVDPWLVAGVLVVGSAIAWVSSYLPARVHTRMTPIEALGRGR